MIRAAIALLLVAFVGSASGEAAARDGRRPFDFHVLTLSWSPTWCATEGLDGGPSRQCRAGAGLGFVVHGLWPQFEVGYPEFCAGDEAEWVPSELAAEMADIMPDRQLVFHTWRKHGTCTGTDPAAYFAETRAAFEAVRIPAAFTRMPADRLVSPQAVERAFIDANPGMEPSGIALRCEDKTLVDVRICLTPDMTFRSCPELDRRGCRSREIVVPAPG